jgi:GDP/UDP-N,N'-diacetylbacillosamine 2-epimerase (hydrolysing)
MNYIKKDNLAVVTGSRAEYGLLLPLIKLIKNNSFFNLQLIVTGMHLSSDFGNTENHILEDGLAIDDKIEMLLSGDNEVSVVKSIGVGMIGFADSYKKLQPDYLIMLGDRYELLAAATAGYIFKIPIIHFRGGETTEGAFDEGIRHCITKLSSLHFASTEEYKNRIIQLGEDPSTVFNVGALGIDIKSEKNVLSKSELENELKFNISNNKSALVTFHPVTLDDGSSLNYLNELFRALNEFRDMNIIFTGANADNEGKIINQEIYKYVQNRKNSIFVNSLGSYKYLSLLNYIDIVIGNSSSGISEVPSFHKPTVNIGNRQKGRIKAESVIDCSDNSQDIIKAIKKAFSAEFIQLCKTVINPYENTNSANDAYEIIIQNISKINLKKKFYDLSF